MRRESSSTRIQTPSTSCTNNTFVTNELFSFWSCINKNHDTQTRLWHGFQTTTTFWRQCMEQIQLSIPE